MGKGKAERLETFLQIQQELRSWFEVNAKFPSTTPRLNITFSFHDPHNKKYKLRTVDELGKGMAIY